MPAIIQRLFGRIVEKTWQGKRLSYNIKKSNHIPLLFFFFNIFNSEEVVLFLIVNAVDFFAASFLIEINSFGVFFFIII